MGALFDASPNAYVIFDEALMIVGCNRAYLKEVGRASSNEIVGQYLFDAFPSSPDSASYRLLRRSLDKVLANHEQDHIAVIPYDTSEPGQPPNMRYWSATHTPIFDRDGVFRYILQHTVDVTELQRLRERGAHELFVEAGVLHRARQVQADNQAINAERELLRDMFKQAPGFIGVLAGPAHTFIQANDAYTDLVGGRELVGLTVAEALPEVVGQGFIDLLDAVYASGEPYIGKQVPVMLRQAGEAAPSKRYIDFIYQPILSEDGEVSGIFVQGHDVTEQVEAERMQSLRHRELGHRLKNQLAMVQAIVNQTIRASTDLSTAGSTIAGRLQALSRAHESLITGTTGLTSVGEIARTTAEIHDHGSLQRFRIEGPPVEIASRSALSLSLILHELTTNAVKYGALSNENGRVHVTWDVAGDEDTRRFTLVWREVDGPPVSPPSRNGAGTRLIKAGLAGTVSSDVTVSFDVTGIVCRIDADFASMGEEAD
nr:PAS domain-containing protein [Aquibium carbonis]